MKNIAVITLFIIGFYSCSSRIDYSNPKSVIENYFMFKNNSKLQKAYDLIADTCKEFVNLQDYFDNYKLDSSYYPAKCIIKEIEQLPIDPNFKKYRRYEISYLSIRKSNSDTTKNIIYYSAFNENGKWKILWTQNLFNSAIEQMDSQNFKDATTSFKDLLKYDPLNGAVYMNLGWCYYFQRLYEEAMSNAHRAIKLSPKEMGCYNLLAALYGKDNYELAIENFKKALDFCYSDKEKAVILSNMAYSYNKLILKDEALSTINKSISFNSKNTHSWWIKGIIYDSMKNIDSSLYCYQRAVSLEKMPDNLQKQLYFNLANSLYNKGILTEVLNTKMTILKDAKSNVIKALDFQPDDNEYKQLLNDINRVLK